MVVDVVVVAGVFAVLAVADEDPSGHGHGRPLPSAVIAGLRCRVVISVLPTRRNSGVLATANVMISFPITVRSIWAPRCPQLRSPGSTSGVLVWKPWEGFLGMYESSSHSSSRDYDHVNRGCQNA